MNERHIVLRGPCGHLLWRLGVYSERKFGLILGPIDRGICSRIDDQLRSISIKERSDRGGMCEIQLGPRWSKDRSELCQRAQ